MRSGLLAEGSSYSGDAAGGKLSDVSRELQVIGARLETVYPNLYQNVSRQVNITLKVYTFTIRDGNNVHVRCLHVIYDKLKTFL